MSKTVAVNDHESRLPRNWESEYVTGIRCQKMVEGKDGWTLHLASDADHQYWGIRPGSTIEVPPAHSAKFSMNLEILDYKNITKVYAIIREWNTAGQFLYQVQKSIAISKERTLVEIYLTVREPERLVQPVILFERSGTDESTIEIALEGVAVTYV